MNIVYRGAVGDWARGTASASGPSSNAVQPRDPDVFWKTWGHHFDFDPTYGYDTEALLAIPAPEAPAGFDAFWQSTYEENAQAPLVFERVDVEHSETTWDVYQVYFDSWGGHRTGAWVVAPRNRPIRCGVVAGHGYGGRKDYCTDLNVEDAVYIFCVARGFYISGDSGVPYNNASQHVIHGVESKENYVLRGCVAELWAAASVLLDLYPDVKENLFYWGTSFGGGLGALMLPWDSRFKRAYLNVPCFGYQAFLRNNPASGSGGRLHELRLAKPEIDEVLAFYDAAVSATRISIPMFINAAVFDPVVPPPSQFALANALAGPVDLFISSAGHFDATDSAKEASRRDKCVRKFFKMRIP